MNLLHINREYKKKGYCIVDFFSSSQIDIIKECVIRKLKKLENNSNYLKKFNKIKMENYHFLKIPEKEHKKILKTSSRYILLNKLLMDYVSKNQYANSIMLSNWGHNRSLVKWVGSFKKKQIKKKAIGFRISRPYKVKKKDATGVHCDLHVGGKICNDKNVLITVWVPLVGFSKKYSLRLSPKSHLVNHPTKKFLNSKTVTNVFPRKYYKSFKFLRPKLKKGQAIIFHPNLLHGNSFNFGKKTRFSIEIRFYNKKNIKNWLN